ncbi:hypothetical protein Plhal304r1_c021g0075781 [Plasmopara halstedii]
MLLSSVEHAHSTDEQKEKIPDNILNAQNLQEGLSTAEERSILSSIDDMFNFFRNPLQNAKKKYVAVKEAIERQVIVRESLHDALREAKRDKEWAEEAKERHSLALEHENPSQPFLKTLIDFKNVLTEVRSHDKKIIKLENEIAHLDNSKEYNGKRRDLFLESLDHDGLSPDEIQQKLNKIEISLNKIKSKYEEEKDVINATFIQKMKEHDNYYKNALVRVKKLQELHTMSKRRVKPLDDSNMIA